jgi:thiol-disulfide isomerase/thioredoxin
MSRPRWLPVAVSLVPALLLAAGCAAPTGPAPRPEPPSPFAGCAALTAPPPRAPATAPAGGGAALPDLALPCVTGGEQVRLAGLRGPAVVNLWGSWCAPCREELPALQRYAARTAGTVHVVGVVTRDDRAAAKELAADLGVTFPALDDPGEQVLSALRRAALPVTFFVDGRGRVRHVYNSTALDEAALSRLVERHLGVTVTG